VKKVTFVKVAEVEVKTFYLSDFSDQQRDKSSKEKVSREKISKEKISKKVMKRLAKEMGLNSSDEELVLARKLLEAYLAKR